MELAQLKERLNLIITEIDKATGHLNMLIGGREELKLIIQNLESEKPIEVIQAVEKDAEC